MARKKTSKIKKTTKTKKTSKAKKPRKVSDNVVFSHYLARKRRDKAIDQVEAAADLAWLQTAYAALLHVARMRRTFTADHVWLELVVRATPPPREPRAMGAVFREALRGHVCEALTMHDVCGRPKRHYGLVRVWQSLVYNTGKPTPSRAKVLRSSTYGKAATKKPATKKATAKKTAAKKTAAKKTAAKKAAAKKTSAKKVATKQPNWKLLANGRKVHFPRTEQGR